MRSQQTCSVKGQIGNNLGFVDHMVYFQLFNSAAVVQNATTENT